MCRGNSKHHLLAVKCVCVCVCVVEMSQTCNVAAAVVVAVCTFYVLDTVPFSNWLSINILVITEKKENRKRIGCHKVPLSRALLSS